MESRILQLSSYLYPFKTEELFSKSLPLEIEIGCGNGSFLINYAQKHPDLNLIGVERLLGRVRKVDRKAGRAESTNIRLLRLDAYYLLKYLIPDESIQAIHIYFPDPWPKRKHLKKRLIQEGFPLLCTRILETGGTVHLRTDHEHYFRQMEEVFTSENSIFVRTDTPKAILELETEFEVGFKRQGCTTYATAFQKKD